MTTNGQYITSATQYYLFSQYCENILFVLTEYSYLIFTLCTLSCNGGTRNKNAQSRIVWHPTTVSRPEDDSSQAATHKNNEAQSVGVRAYRSLGQLSAMQSLSWIWSWSASETISCHDWADASLLRLHPREPTGWYYQASEGAYIVYNSSTWAHEGCETTMLVEQTRLLHMTHNRK